MANTGFKGVDVRQTGNQLVFRAFLQDSAGAKVATGTTTIRIVELQSDGTLKGYDFNDNTFKTTALTTGTLALTHRTTDNGTVNTGIWTNALSTLTGFTVGGIYLLQVNNSGASPTDQTREFQYGSSVDDLSLDSSGYVRLQATQTGVTIPNVTTVGSVTGAVGSVTGAVGSVTGAVGSVTGNVGGNVTGSVGSVVGAVGSVTAGVIVATNNDKTGYTASTVSDKTGYSLSNSQSFDTSGSVGSVTGNVGGNVTGSVGSVVGAVGSVTGAVASVTGNVGGNVTGSVGSVVGAVGSVTGNVGGNVTGSVASVVGAVGSVTGNVGGNVTGTVASVIGNVGGNVVGSVGSVSGSVTVGTNNDKTGYTLTVTPPTAAQINTVLSTAHGSGSWEGGGGGGGGFDGPFSLTLHFRDADGDPVPGVTFTLVGLGSAITDVNGDITIGVPEGVYTVLASPQSGSIFTSTEIDTDDDNEFTIEGSAIAAPPSAPAPGLCVLYVDVYNAAGTEVGNLYITELPHQFLDGSFMMGYQELGVTTGGDDRITFAGVPIGCEVIVEVPAARLMKQVKVPNSSTYRVNL